MGTFDTKPKPPTQGRPVATSHAEIERAAFHLFNERGFERTTVDAIAREVGIGRRTLFRYFRSKNDIPWGQFDRTLTDFRRILASMPSDIPLYRAVHEAVVRFNEFDLDAHPSHRDRMSLILSTPSLQAHSVLRYEEWRSVIATYVAGRLGIEPDDLLPRTVGHVSLAVALSSYTTWLERPEASLQDILNDAFADLRQYLSQP